MKKVLIDASEAGHRLAVLHGNYLFDTGLESDLKSVERTYVMVWRFQAEIYNGGIWQFFTNSTQAYMPYICEELTKIDAHEMSEIMSEAIANLQPGTPWHAAQAKSTLRRDAPTAVQDCVGDLEYRLYPYLDNLSLLLFTYMLKFRHELDVSDDFWSEVPLQ